MNISEEKQSSNPFVPENGTEKVAAHQDREARRDQSLACPKCGSDSWKSLSFLYNAGIMDVNTETNTTGRGIGIGTGGVGVGVSGSTGNTAGSLQSGLSALAAPPEKPQKIHAGVIYWGLVLLFLAMSGKENTVVGFVVLVIAIYSWSGFNARSKAQGAKDIEDYQIASARWERSRMCQRCGEIYDPENAKSTS